MPVQMIEESDGALEAIVRGGIAQILSGNPCNY